MLQYSPPGSVCQRAEIKNPPPVSGGSFTKRKLHSVHRILSPTAIKPSGERHSSWRRPRVETNRASSPRNPAPDVAVIAQASCSRRGLPRALAHARTGELLPHLFTLTLLQAVCFLWHFPSWLQSHAYELSPTPRLSASAIPMEFGLSSPRTPLQAPESGAPNAAFKEHTSETVYAAGTSSR